MQRTLRVQGERPAACTGCRSCEAVCPQQIKIADVMKRMTDDIPVW